MKTRNGFVSNSSSTSFLIKISKDYNMNYNDYDFTLIKNKDDLDKLLKYYTDDGLEKYSFIYKKLLLIDDLELFDYLQIGIDNDLLYELSNRGGDGLESVRYLKNINYQIVTSENNS